MSTYSKPSTLCESGEPLYSPRYSQVSGTLQAATLHSPIYLEIANNIGFVTFTAVNPGSVYIDFDILNSFITLYFTNREFSHTSAIVMKAFSYIAAIFCSFSTTAIAAQSFSASNLYYAAGLTDSQSTVLLDGLKSAGVKVLRVWLDGEPSVWIQQFALCRLLASSQANQATPRAPR